MSLLALLGLRQKLQLVCEPGTLYAFYVSTAKLPLNWYDPNKHLDVTLDCTDRKFAYLSHWLYLYVEAVEKAFGEETTRIRFHFHGDYVTIRSILYSDEYRQFLRDRTAFLTKCGWLILVLVLILVWKSIN